MDSKKVLSKAKPVITDPNSAPSGSIRERLRSVRASISAPPMSVITSPNTETTTQIVTEPVSFVKVEEVGDDEPLQLQVLQDEGTFNKT